MADLNYDPRPPERRAQEVADQQAADQRYGWLALVGAGLVAVGSMLPWVEAHTAFGTVSLNGTEGDGQLSLVGAGIFALIWFIADLSHKASSGWMIAEVGLAVAGFIFAIVKMNDIQEAITEADSTYVTASVGVGLWVCLAGAVVALAACVMKVRR